MWEKDYGWDRRISDSASCLLRFPGHKCVKGYDADGSARRHDDDL